MTDLTKQWEKGELESGWYFVKVGNYEAEIDLYDDDQNQWFNCCDKDIYPVKVLAPVPTYQEYLESEAHCAVYSEVNKQLRELLKECKANFIHRKQLLEKLEELEKPTIDLLTRINAVIGESEE